MPSNHRLRMSWFLLLLMSCTLVSCSYFFGEKEKETEVEYQGKVGTCVTPSNNLVSGYFNFDSNFEYTDAGVDSAVECYRDTIQSFVRNTKSGGLNSDEYTAENIDNFLSEFYPDFGLNLEQIRSYIYLKAFLIGGSDVSVTKEELLKIHDLVKVVGLVLKNLSNEREVILQKAVFVRTDLDYQRFKNSFKLLKTEIGSLIAEFDKHSNNSNADFSKIVGFLIGEYFGESAEDKAKFLPLVIAYKNFVTNSSGVMLNRNDLGYMIRQAIVLYEALLQYQSFVQEDGPLKIFQNLGHITSFIMQIPAMLNDSSMFKTVALKSVVDVISNIEGVAKYSVRARKSQRVRYSKIHDLIMGLKEAELVRDGMATALTTFLEIFAQKWLDPYEQGVKDLTIGKVDYIRKLLNEWVNRQQIANSLFRSGSGNEVSLVSRGDELSKHPEFISWVNRLKKINTHQWDEMGRVLYSNDLTRFTYEELTVSNSLITIGDLFMRPYNLDKKSVEDYVLSESNAQEMYEVLRILGVEMAFMDSRIFDSGKRSFMEGNLFSGQRRNDDELDYFEAYEYLSVALAAGRLADRIYDDLLAQHPNNCHRENIIDVHDKKVTRKNCYDRFVKENYTKYFSHLPTITDYWQSRWARGKNKFYYQMEIASRAGVETKRDIDLGEIRVLVSMNYYLQSIFNLFDKNSDGVAQGDELVEAEKHFRPMITNFLAEKVPEILFIHRGKLHNLICYQVKRDREATDFAKFKASEEVYGLAACIAPRVFVHLVEHGNMPTGTFYGGWFLLDNLFGGNGPEDELIDFHDPGLFSRYSRSATPQTVADIFGALARITHDSHVNQIWEYLTYNKDELLESLKDDEAPACLEKSTENPFEHVKQPFCLLARQLYCNETVNQEVYTYFKRNKLKLFDWKADKSIFNWYQYKNRSGPYDAMTEIYSDFHRHELFSTHCGFPQVLPGYWKNLGEGITGQGTSE